MTERFVTVLGHRTRYFEDGEGKTVVLLHGADLTSDSEGAWAPIYADLARSFRVVALDQLGFGETESPTGVGVVSRLDRVPHAIAFLDALEISGASLIGHSEGAFVAVRIAVERPSLVDQLVIIASGSVAPRLGGAADDGWIAASGRAYDYARVAGSEEEIVAMAKALCMHHHPALEAHVRAGYRRAAGNGRLEAWRATSAESDIDAYMRVQEEWIQPHLSTLTLPTLLLWAADDATVGVARGVRLMESIPNADLYVLRHAAHMVMWDRTAAVQSLLQGWLHDTAE